MIPIKALVITTAIAAVALFLKAYAPTAVEISVFWSSLNSWLKPPYLLVLINVIITIIVASSSYYHSGEDEEIKTKPIVNRATEVKDSDFNYLVTEVERSEVVCEEKDEEEEEEISGVINGGDQVPSSKIDESLENLPPAEKKPLVSARSDHRKPVKLSAKGGKRKKALKVVKPKPAFEKTWKSVLEELESTPLTARYRRSQTFGVDHVGEVKPALRKTVTFRDITNHQKSPTVTPPPVKVKVKEEMLPSDEELNRRVEAFIKKTKQERLESLRLDKRSSLRRKL